MRNTIMTLENGINYYIIDDIEIEGRTFVIGSLIKVSEQDIDDENLLVKEVIQNDEGGYEIISIEDQKDAEQVTMRLLEKIKDSNYDDIAE